MKAFPLKAVNKFDDSEGMDLRDYFAAQALTGAQIWDIEIIEEEPLAIIRIFFNENEDDYIEINAEYMQMLYISPKPTKLH